MLYYHSGVLLEDDQAVLYLQLHSSSAEQNIPSNNNVVNIVHVTLALRFFALGSLALLHNCLICAVSFSVYRTCTLPREYNSNGAEQNREAVHFLQTTSVSMLTL